MHPMSPHPKREGSFPNATLSLGPEGLRLSTHRGQDDYVDACGPACPDHCARLGGPVPVETVLEEAARLTSGDRQKDYGHPRLHFACTAALVSTYLRRRGLLTDTAQLDAQDWACLMLLDKISRYAGGRKRDCLVDVAGYARTAEMLGEAP